MPSLDILSINMNYLEKSYLSVCKATHILSSMYDNICFPVCQEFAFDIVGIKNNDMHRIKVLRTECKAPSGSYVVNIRNNDKKFPFDPSMCEMIFVDSPDGLYFIPSKIITQKRAISLSMFKDYLLRLSSAVEQETVNFLVGGSNPSDADILESGKR